MILGPIVDAGAISDVHSRIEVPGVSLGSCVAVGGGNMLKSVEGGKCAFCVRDGHSCWDCNSPYNDMTLGGTVKCTTIRTAGHQAVAAISSFTAIKIDDENDDKAMSMCGSSGAALVEYPRQHTEGACKEVLSLFQKCLEDDMDVCKNAAEIISRPEALTTKTILDDAKTLTKEDQKALRDEGLYVYISLLGARNKDVIKPLGRFVASNSNEEASAIKAMSVELDKPCAYVVRYYNTISYDAGLMSLRKGLFRLDGS